MKGIPDEDAELLVKRSVQAEALSNGGAFERIGIGMRESDTELRAKFDAAIQTMKDDGTLNTLITKWFGPEAPTF